MINFRNLKRKFIAAGVAAVFFSLSLQKVPVLATNNGTVSFSMIGKYDFNENRSGILLCKRNDKCVQKSSR